MLKDLFYNFTRVEEICHTEPESVRDKYNLIADLLLVTTDDLIVVCNNDRYVSYMIEKFKSGELISHIKENDFVNDEEDYIKDIKIYEYKSEKLAKLAVINKSEKLAVINNGELLVLQY